MSVVIPWTRIAAFALRPVRYAGEQAGALGGPDIDTPRLGDRYAVDVSTAQFRLDGDGRDMIAALTEALSVDARMAVRLPNMDGGWRGVGAVVDGAGQGGTTIALRGMAPAATLLRSQPFHILHGGLHYIHTLSAPVTVAGDGRAVLPIWPMLRFLTLDGSPCEFAEPMIEGKLTGFTKGARFVRNQMEAVEFVIGERR